MALSQPIKAPAALASPRRRRLVVFALVLVSFMTILGRVGISAAKTEIARDLGISDLTIGIVFGAFALGLPLKFSSLLWPIFWGRVILHGPLGIIVRSMGAEKIPRP